MIKNNVPLPLENNADDFSILADFMKGSSVESSVLNSEGQLAIDVVQTQDEVIIVAPMAGCKAQNLELHLQNDVLTIRGERQSPFTVDSDFFYRECYWGKFSRTIVLPVEVKVEMARAEFKNGILIVALPKTKVDGNIPIIIVEE
ncbi:MAG: Hsp20/alpha crystallin family protein [Candidatus Magasanikbacteria bacterium]|nr:Hsp20/alpha crystallin family protein [Candidatus Magasanikbacteria bacterium]